MVVPVRSPEVAGGPAGRPDAPSRRFDPALVPVALVTLAVYVLHGHHGSLSRDLSIYAYAGQRVFDGSPPYVDVLNRAGPLAHMVPALGVAVARVAGVGDVVGMRMVYLLAAVAAVVAIYVLCRDLLRSRAAGIAGAAAMLSFHGFAAYASDGPREKTVMVLFLVLCFVAVQRRSWFWAGVWLSLATLTLQISFPLGAGAAVVAILCAPGRRWRSMARVVVGGLVPLGLFVVYFAAVGALGDFARAFLLINARYTVASPVWGRAGWVWRDLHMAYGVSLYVLLGGLAVLIAGGLVGVVGLLRRRQGGAATLVPLAAATVIGVAWTLHDINGWPDAFPLLPLGAVGFAVFVALVVRHLDGRAAIAVVAAVAVAATLDACVYAVTARTDTLDMQRAVARATARHLPRDATYFTMGAPQPLVLLGKRAVSKYVLLSAGLESYVDHTYPGGLAGLDRWVARRHPTVITVSRHGAPGWLVPTLSRDYRRVGSSPWQTWASRSLGHHKLRKMRHAIHRARRSPPGAGG